MFENIFGNNSIKKVLEQSIYSNKVSHSYLMIGISGIGKKMIATEFAKGILCLSENKSCNYCKSCIEFDGNIESLDECSHFLSIYLEEAKQTEMEIGCEYEAYLWDID